MLDDIETIAEGSKPTLFIIVIALVYISQKYVPISNNYGLLHSVIFWRE